MTIWIVRKHPRAPLQFGYWLDAFTIASACATRKEAKEIADKKNKNRNSTHRYTVGSVTTKDRP